MSSYFDALAREVAEGPEDPEEFLEHVRRIEARVFGEVCQLTGDREFPDDLREKILGIFAVKSVHTLGAVAPSAKAVDWVKSMRSSRCLEDLHDAFHDVARRRHETRFGRLTDHPAFDLARRDEHDAEVPQ